MVDVTKVHEIVERHGGKKEHMIAILLDCQEEFVTFRGRFWRKYPSRLEHSPDFGTLDRHFLQGVQPEALGRHQIHVCMGTACNIRAAPGSSKRWSGN